MAGIEKRKEIKPKENRRGREAHSLCPTRQEHDIRPHANMHTRAGSEHTYLERELSVFNTHTQTQVYAHPLAHHAHTDSIIRTLITA